MELRIGQGYDIHKLEISKKLIIGAVEIDYEKGFVAHSDGDVLIHALIDSILGALNLGDIGTHFPDNDPKYKGIASSILLKKIGELIEKESYKIVNIDSTIICEKPKLKDYIPLMKESLSQILNISSNLISIKAKTKEGLDATGRNESIEAFVVVLLLLI